MSRSRNTSKISQRALQREVLFRQQRGLCADCGCAMVLPPKRRGGMTPLARNTATLEHKVARSLGGTDSVDNLAVTCHGCNNRKSADEFRAHQRVLGYRL